MRNLHLILHQEFGLEARRLFREWERLWLRSSDYKNHRVFSLRCLYKNLIPVSIKLKSTLDTSRARKIIRKAEKDLLQARIKSINSVLVQVDREIEECKAKLASTISAVRFQECQDFINKVSEFRFNKVRQRQINKLNKLVSKKEGNITNHNITNPINRQAHCNSCTPTLATALLPPGEGSNALPATVQPSSEGNSSSPSNQSNNINTSNRQVNPINSSSIQANNNSTNRQSHSPAIAHLPPGEGSSSLPVAVHLPPEDASSSQQIGFTPTMEENNSSQATTPPTPSSPHPLVHPKQGITITLPGQADKAIGTPQATSCTTFPGGLHNLPRRQHHLHPP